MLQEEAGYIDARPSRQIDEPSCNTRQINRESNFHLAMVCISAAILIVAKLEKVSEIA